MKTGILFALTALLLVSCTSEKEQRPAQQAAPQKSQFEQVREQTVKDPKDVDAWSRLADMYESSQMYNEEAAALKTIITLKPAKRYAYVRLGNTYNRLGRYQEAIDTFLAGAKYPPPDPVLYNNLAASYGMVGKTNAQISALEKAISLRPRYATAHYNLGVVYLKKGRRDEALKQYNELNKFDEGTAKTLKKEIDAARK
jgi:tetratricopeptide (TPR) repeat protein